MAFFQQRNILTAIEIGTSKICVLIGEFDEQGSVSIISHVEKELTGAVRKGEIVDMDIINDSLFTLIGEAESISQTNVDNGSVYVAVTGSHIGSQQNSACVILTEDNKTITADHLAESTELAKVLRLQPGDSVINCFDSYYLIDGKRRLSNPVGHRAHKLNAFVHLIYGDQNRIDNFKSTINELGVEAQVNTVFSAVASAYGALSDEEYSQGVLLVEFGAGTTEFLVFKDTGVRHSGVLSIGCEHLANDIALGLDISFPAASDLLISKKYDHHKQKGDQYIELSGTLVGSKRKLPIASIEKIIDARLRELAEILYEEINSHNLIQELTMGVVLSGGGALLAPTPEIFNAVFRTPVRVAKPTKISCPPGLDSPRYTTVCGLLKCGLILQEAERANLEQGLMAKTSTMLSRFISPIASTFNEIKESVKF